MKRTFMFGTMPAAGLIVAGVLLFACSVKPAVTVTDEDNGTKVEVKCGDVLAVRLSAQLGTGFGWKVVSVNNNLSIKGEPEQITKEVQKPGSSDYQTFRFEAIRAGESELKLVYIEGWKKNATPLKDFTITVIVK
ncbi:MAG: protease inhibitor I42 family protein [Spirochaetes bacterium]|nr:protease inhibitor I42 family protein [Spirochaetota bacterium]